MLCQENEYYVYVAPCMIRSAEHVIDEAIDKWATLRAPALIL